TQPSEGDLENYATGKGYNSNEWQRWFELYFEKNPDQKNITEKIRKNRQNDDQNDEKFMEMARELAVRFPFTTRSLRESLENRQSISREKSSKNPIIGDIWTLKHPAGVFRTKPVVIAEVREKAIVGLPLTDIPWELPYANEMDLILEP